MLQAELRVVGGKHHGKVIPLSKQKFLIGRESDCQLRPNSELVSRHHCVFTIDQYSVRLRDLGSTNGTHVDDKPIHGVVTLESGNKISIGKLEFEIVIREVPDVEITPEMVPHDSSVDTEHMSKSDTATEFELPTQAGYNTNTPMETTIIHPSGQQPSTPQPIIPPGYQQPGSPYPQMPGYQTPPGGFPMQPMGYPPQQMMPQFQQPGMYPPMSYPQQPMGYPQQPPPGYPQPPAQPAPAEPEPEPEETEGSKTLGTVPVPPTQLPDPSSTGATAQVEAPPPKEEGDEENEEKESNPSERAADIIKKRLNRNPLE